MPTSVSLGSHYETYVVERLRSGRFNNVSEVVRAGLRLPERQEEEHELRMKALRAECERLLRHRRG